MSSKCLIALCGLVTLSLMGVTQPIKDYSLVSLMDGQSKFIMPTNDTITLPVWGYGVTSPEPYVVLPAPTVYAKEGDSVHLEMINPSMEGHTIHLHGLDVDQANDGVPHTSDFIQQGESFTYRFKATHAGNFLYHCHVTSTMHLTLGMYGMVIVYPADSSNRIYTNGPTYDVQHEYLFSDMDSRWNADYTAIGSFLSYEPDLFLVNGKNKQLLYDDPAVHVLGSVGEEHLLRLLNVGYRVNRVIFPQTLQATVHTSDGRVLDPFETDTLMVYPGERYSVMAEILDTATSFVAVDFLDPYRLKFLGREYIPVNDADFEYFDPGIEDDFADSIGVGEQEVKVQDFLMYPNPARDVLFLTSTSYDWISVHCLNAQGQEVRHTTMDEGLNSIDISDLSPGFYFIVVTNSDGMRRSKRLVIEP